jgi:hypothetical protein
MRRDSVCTTPYYNNVAAWQFISSQTKARPVEQLCLAHHVIAMWILSCSFRPEFRVPVTRTGDSGPQAPEWGSGPERDERGAHGLRDRNSGHVVP